LDYEHTFEEGAQIQNYIGPKTKTAHKILNKVLPQSQGDDSALHHDLDYYLTTGDISGTRVADLKAILGTLPALDPTSKMVGSGLTVKLVFDILFGKSFNENIPINIEQRRDAVKKLLQIHTTDYH
jgi:hypothetical protein